MSQLSHIKRLSSKKKAKVPAANHNPLHQEEVAAFHHGLEQAQNGNFNFGLFNLEKGKLRKIVNDLERSEKITLQAHNGNVIIKLNTPPAPVTPAPTPNVPAKSRKNNRKVGGNK